jgi:hypothetical protein
MAQPKQMTTGLPGGEFSIIDNGAAGVVSTNNTSGPNGGSGNWTGTGAASGGFDLAANGALAQATNPFGDVGSTTMDTVNDTVYADPGVATVKGNPVSATQPTYATVSTVLNSSLSTRLLFKNPAIIL